MPDVVPDADVLVIGAGPAGLMAAQMLADAGWSVGVCDAMPSAARKLLLAGKGGLNITHSEPADTFVTRYGGRAAQLAPSLAAFGQQALRDWVHGLGVSTFVGSSGRVFPSEMKAAPMLRAWLHRLRAAPVRFYMRHRWVGWDDDGYLRFDHDGKPVQARPRAVVLALGGASWPRLGSDGRWVPWLAERGIQVMPLRPANCGFDVGWSPVFRQRFAGQPVKAVAAAVAGDPADAAAPMRQGEFVITEVGVEGSLVYSLAAALRDRLEAGLPAVLQLDLAPGRSLQSLADRLGRERGSRSMANHLRVAAGIDGVKAGLLRERLAPAVFNDANRLAQAIKCLAVPVLAPRPVDEAISSAGGVSFAELDANLMLTRCPGVFCAGEMLDWEAPTGGYLLTAAFATGRAAGAGVDRWLRAQRADLDRHPV